MVDLQAPLLPMKGVPPAEAEFANALQGNLSTLAALERDFRMALRLFDHVGALESQSKPREPDFIEGPTRRIQFFKDSADHGPLHSTWKTFAARIGAMTIYSVIQVMKGAQDNAARCPFLGVDLKAMREAIKKTKAAFPGWLGLRTIAAHVGELAKNPQGFTDHARKGAHEGQGISKVAGSKIYIGTGLSGTRTFSGSFGHEICAYDLSQETHAKLRETIEGFWAVLRPPPPA